jgi:hypothetical protein
MHAGLAKQDRWCMMDTFQPSLDMDTTQRNVITVDLKRQPVSVSASYCQILISDQTGNEILLSNGDHDLLAQVAAACIDSCFNEQALALLQDKLVAQCTLMDKAAAGKAES